MPRLSELYFVGLMISFKNRQSIGIPFCGSHPLKQDPLDESRVFEVGEEVLIRPEIDIALRCEGWVRATVVAVTGVSLRVKAVHSLYPLVGECLIQAGDEFDVARGQVFVVTVP